MKFPEEESDISPDGLNIREVRDAEPPDRLHSVPFDLEIIASQICLLLQSCPDDRPIPPLMVPYLPNSAAEFGISPEQAVMLLFEVMSRDPYFTRECVVVCFDTFGGPNGPNRAFGIAKIKDRNFWLSRQGQAHLNAKRITAYTIPGYLAALRQYLPAAPKFDQ